MLTVLMKERKQGTRRFGFAQGLENAIRKPVSTENLPIFGTVPTIGLFAIKSFVQLVAL